MSINILSYTSLSPNPCSEKMNLPLGYPCMSKSILKKLHKLEKELNKDNPNPIPNVVDEEMLPSDGSKDAHMIRRLAATLNCDSEYCILTQDVVKKVLTEDEIKKEKARFKVPGPRLSNVGTEGEKHAYRTLLKWAEVFDFFFPLPNAVYAGDYTRNVLNVDKVMSIINDHYPDIRVLASDMSILIQDKNVCIGHAIVILIDIRGDDFEEWTVEYFDASGSPPPDIIIPFMEDMAKNLREFRKKEKHTGSVHVVPVTGMLRHQMTTTECGMHSLIYIRRRLEGISYRMFSKYKIPDNFAREFRRDIFVT
jgi:hypothetical protein